MHIYIALLRGINVGGSNKVKMKDLTIAMETAGFENVKTYIQSGNIVFSHKEANLTKIADSLQETITQKFSFTPRVLVLTVEDYKAALAANPFPHATDDPKTLHLFFMQQKASSPDLEILEALKTPGEEFKIDDKVFYLFAPHGLGRSKLAEKVEKALGVAATARNWRSATKIADLAASLETA